MKYNYQDVKQGFIGFALGALLLISGMACAADPVPAPQGEARVQIMYLQGQVQSVQPAPSDAAKIRLAWDRVGIMA